MHVTKAYKEKTDTQGPLWFRERSEERANRGDQLVTGETENHRRDRRDQLVTGETENHRNFVYDRNGESPIVVMKPARSPANRAGRAGNDSPPSSFRSRSGPRRNSNEASPAVSPRRDRSEMDRNVRHQARGRNASSPTRSESSVKSPSRRRSLRWSPQVSVEQIGAEMVTGEAR